MFNDFQCHVWLPEGICQMGSTGPCSLSLKRFGHQPSSPRRGWRALGCRLTSGTYHPAVKVGGMFGHMRIWKLKDSKGFHWFPLFKLGTGANSGPNVLMIIIELVILIHFDKYAEKIWKLWFRGDCHYLPLNRRFGPTLRWEIIHSSLDYRGIHILPNLPVLEIWKMCFAHSVRPFFILVHWFASLRLLGPSVQNPRDESRGMTWHQGLGWSPDPGNAGTSAERHLCMAGRGEGLSPWANVAWKTGRFCGHFGYTHILGLPNFDPYLRETRWCRC
jgi:hypothetical protein